MCLDDITCVSARNKNFTQNYFYKKKTPGHHQLLQAYSYTEVRNWASPCQTLNALRATEVISFTTSDLAALHQALHRNHTRQPR